MKFQITMSALNEHEPDPERVERLMEKHDFSEFPDDPQFVDGASGDFAKFLEYTRQSTREQLKKMFDGDPEFLELTVEVIEGREEDDE